VKKTGNRKIDESTALWVVGSDEAGYGAWAGPLLVASVALPRGWEDPRVTDSKALTERRREALFDEFRDKISVSALAVSPETIDEMGVYEAVIMGHKRVLRKVIQELPGEEPLIVADGNLPLEEVGAISLPKADALVPSVSLASIFAKVIRDRIMRKLAKRLPGYGFEKHMGYGVPAHQKTLRELGVCSIHRKSYRPVAKILNSTSTTDDKFPWEIEE
jgi:ribonuclease HII